MFELTPEVIKENGFELRNQENLIIDYVKKIDDRKDLVFAISPVLELFVWVKDEDFEDPEMNGMKVHLNASNCTIEELIKIAETITGVE